MFLLPPPPLPLSQGHPYRLRPRLAFSPFFLRFCTPLPSPFSVLFFLPLLGFRHHDPSCTNRSLHREHDLPPPPSSSSVPPSISPRSFCISSGTGALLFLPPLHPFSAFSLCHGQSPFSHPTSFSSFTYPIETVCEQASRSSIATLRVHPTVCSPSPRPLVRRPLTHPPPPKCVSHLTLPPHAGLFCFGARLPARLSFGAYAHEHLFRPRARPFSLCRPSLLPSLPALVRGGSAAVSFLGAAALATTRPPRSLPFARHRCRRLDCRFFFFFCLFADVDAA